MTTTIFNTRSVQVATLTWLLAALALAAPGHAIAGEKVIGFGGTGAWGPGNVTIHGDHMPGLDIDGGFEFRLHPTDAFSFDFLFDFAPLVVSRGQVGEMKTFFHFHAKPYANQYFSVAPYIGVAGNMDPGHDIGSTSFVSGIRIGGEAHSSDHDFAMGIYARPGVAVSEGAFSAYIAINLTWIVYPPIPRSN